MVKTTPESQAVLTGEKPTSLNFKPAFLPAGGERREDIHAE
jgi:hypothetical protein